MSVDAGFEARSWGDDGRERLRVPHVAAATRGIVPYCAGGEG